MDLVSGAERVIVLMDHVSKSGAAKLVLGYELSLTGKAVVSRVITDLGVFDVTGTASPSSNWPTESSTTTWSTRPAPR